MKNVLLSFVLIFVGNILYAQQNIEFIQSEIRDIETYLSKTGANLMLSNQQKESLHVVLEAKFKKVEQLLEKKLAKLETSIGMTKIEEDFRPKIEAILNIDQRIEYQHKRRATQPSLSK